MSDSSNASAPIRLIVRLLLTIALVWALPVILPGFITIEGGLAAIALIGVTLTLLNIIVRPIINILTFPLKLFMTVLAIILANAAFLWFLMKLVGMMDQQTVRFVIEGGVWGWIVVSLVLGLANWIIKEILK
jgi:putative membrane protein